MTYGHRCFHSASPCAFAFAGCTTRVALAKIFRPRFPRFLCIPQPFYVRIMYILYIYFVSVVLACTSASCSGGGDTRRDADATRWRGCAAAPAAHQRRAARGSPDDGGITRDGRRVQRDHPRRQARRSPAALGAARRRPGQLPGGRGCASNTFVTLSTVRQRLVRYFLKQFTCTGE